MVSRGYGLGDVSKRVLIRSLRVEVETVEKRLVRERVEAEERLVRERVDRITGRIRKTW